jgi:hypothetical protein
MRLHVFAHNSQTNAGARRFSLTRGPTLIKDLKYLFAFRWVDARGSTVARSRVRSRSCRQPDHRPNLELLGLTVDGGRYLARLANTGRSESGPFELEIGGLATQLVESIAARGEAIVEVSGPACELGAPVTATADPLDEVDERSERDNALTVRCP